MEMYPVGDIPGLPRGCLIKPPGLEEGLPGGKVPGPITIPKMFGPEFPEWL